MLALVLHWKALLLISHSLYLETQDLIPHSVFLIFSSVYLHRFPALNKSRSLFTLKGFAHKEDSLPSVFPSSPLVFVVAWSYTEAPGSRVDCTHAAAQRKLHSHYGSKGASHI